MIELQLFPQINIVAEMREFYREESCRRAGDDCTMERFQEIVQDSISLVLTGPSFFRTITEWVETRLPEIARSFEYEITRAEEVLATAEDIFAREAAMAADVRAGKKPSEVMGASYERMTGR